MKTIHERQKRLSSRKKMTIIDKELKDSEILKEVREREKKLIDYKYGNRVQHNMSSDNFA